MKRSLFLKRAKVILNVNIDVKMGLTNGTIGEIKEIEENIIHFEYEFKGQNLLHLLQEQKKMILFHIFMLRDDNLQLVLHIVSQCINSKVKTLDGVVINWERIQALGLFYSILARWKNSRRIHINNLIVNDHKPQNPERWMPNWIDKNS